MLAQPDVTKIAVTAKLCAGRGLLSLAAPRRFVARVAIQRPRSELDARLLEDAYAPIWEGRDVELVSLSHEVMAKGPEFERVSTTLVNAYVAPKIRRPMFSIAM